MKKIIASITMLSLAGMMVVMGVGAATTGDVSATVTAELVSVSVSDGVVGYGILANSTPEDTTASGVNNTQVATNAGNVNVDLGIRSSDAVGGTEWNLAGTAAADVFTHDFCTTGSGSPDLCDASPTWNAFNVDNTTYSSLAATVAPSGTQDFDLRIGTPTSSTDNVEKTITVTVQATASE